MKKILLLIILLLSGMILYAQDFKLQNGDLIFQEDCAGNTDNTIKAVTASIGDYRFTHVGIVYIDNKDSVYVLEATRPKVALTPLNEYLYPNDKDIYPISVVGRLKEQYRSCIPDALKEGLLLLGKDYDDGFILGNDKYYCSELIYEILLKANGGVPVFPLNVMTFKSPDTGEVTEGWKAYFRRYDLPVPEDEPGINPGAMSRSDVIDIVHYY
ncbi:YiiX/YebB-like N1pC/P60 family cysteine hydrolase [Prevotella sp. 10(H)]|uniref:YiiX/YebB-like N1pC/P60 family cysteine hydrolase n=1 Tax=Prevotella sp. 10(H) TaxID=1158294 RepID=UPI0004A6E8F3|nr:YiiX/YebB-like N1pC/P60 family cysteine hydrolase [Prevotella sp. 10(H)]